MRRWCPPPGWAGPGRAGAQERGLPASPCGVSASAPEDDGPGGAAALRLDASVSRADLLLLFRTKGSLDITQSVDDDPLLDTRLLPHHSLQAHFRPRFHPLPTVIIANLLLFIHVVFVILAFLTGVLCSYPNPNEDKCPGNYTNPLKVQTVIILGKVVLWILHLLLERFIQYQHSKARKRGYSTVYRSTRHLKGLALMVHSSGNTALLLVLCIQHSFPEPARLYLDLLLAILALELLCSLTCLLIYTVRIQKFNRAKPQPDVLEEEKVYAYPSNITSETGFRTISSLEEIVEKQGDIILYLKRHNALLSKRLLALTSSDLGPQPNRM
ncbi:transmembrane protein 192 [Tupaia chinensis]|uniref:transmembrane protein 192 n=1 Tax=Tupaia chinensis TaxID=246437 RepID=UPI0003C8F0F1|nr:transmembrane protein 192 [Tupaia chinensis]